MQTRKDVFEMLQESHGDRSAKIQHVLDSLSNPEGKQNISQVLLRRRQILYSYCNKILGRWNKCKRTRLLRLPLRVVNPRNYPTIGRSCRRNSCSGRSPKTPFQSCSDRRRWRKTVKLREMFSAPELSYAAQMSLRSAGEQDAAHLFKEAMANSH